MKFESKTDLINDVINLEKSDIFKFIYPNTIDRAFVTPNDNYISDQYALAYVDMYQAWEFTKGNSAIKIGILDSGIPIQDGSLSHGDLNDNSRYLFGDDVVDDGNGVKDESGHGTHVSGIVGAITDNSNGIAGSNWNSKLYICQVFDSEGDGSSSNFYYGVKNAVDNGCKVINYSGGGSENPLKEEAVNYAKNNNVLLVVAAGNNNGGTVDYPGALANQYDNLICVSATTSEDRFAEFSSKGSAVTVSAPGENVYSTMPNYHVTDNDNGYSQNYDNMDGTSMSTPYATGVASLIYSLNPGLTPSQVKQILIESSDDIQYYDEEIPVWPFDGFTVGVGRDDYTGYGRINAFKAVSGLRYKLTLRNTGSGKNNLSVGDYVKIWTLSGSYLGIVTISENMIAPDGYWRWNGLLDNGVYCFAGGMYIGLKNGSGSSLEITLQGDVTPPSVSNFSFVTNSRFKMNISEYFDVVWVSASVFDANGNLIRKDFENKISNGGSNKYFNLNSPLNNGQKLKVFLVDNAGNVNSITGKYTVVPLTVSIYGPSIVYYVDRLGSKNENNDKKTIITPARPISDYPWCTYKANPIGGTGQYSYLWKRKISQDTWHNIGSTKNITIQVAMDMTIKCTVTSGDQTASATKTIDFRGGGGPNAAQESEIPDQVVLQDNYPNPFNPSTTIKFGLPEDQHVKITVYNINGQKVISIKDQFMDKGYHDVTWNGLNQSGSAVSSGMYIYALEAGGKKLIKKMFFLK